MASSPHHQTLRGGEPRRRVRGTAAPAGPCPSTTPVIASLADVFCFEANDHNHATTAAAGTVKPKKILRRRFPKALKRLRDRLRLLEERLTLDTNGLRQDVLNLELQKSFLETKLVRRDDQLRQRDHAVAVVHEYFAIFQHGWIQSSAEGVDRQVGSINADRQQSLVARQRQFLATAVDPVIADQLVAHWEQWSELYDEPQLDLERIECVGDADEPIVLAWGVFSARVTPNTFSQGVLPDEHATERLLAERIKYPCRVVCCFAPSGLIIRHDMELDHVVALQRTLGTLEHVHQVVTRRASTRTDGRWLDI